MGRLDGGWSVGGKGVDGVGEKVADWGCRLLTFFSVYKNLDFLFASGNLYIDHGL